MQKARCWLYVGQQPNFLCSISLLRVKFRAPRNCFGIVFVGGQAHGKRDSQSEHTNLREYRGAFYWWYFLSEKIFYTRTVSLLFDAKGTFSSIVAALDLTVLDDACMIGP